MRKIYRTISLMVLCSLALLNLSSCEKAGTELSDLMIIQGIGIDVAKEGYKVTVEILNNEQSGSPSGDSSAENKTKIYNATGESVASALMKLTTKSGNKPFYAQNRVIVLGEATAQRNLTDVLDFFERNYDSRASQLICVAKDRKAEDIIRAKLLTDTVKSKILEKMLESSYEQSLVPRVRIVDAINTIKDDTTYLCIPAVAVQNNGANQDFTLEGCALFDKDESFCMYLSADDARGLAFLDNNIREGFISADLPNGQKATFVIVKGKTYYQIIKENGKLHYRLSIDLVCDLEEVGGAEFFSTDDDFMEKIKGAAGASVAQLAENTLITLQSEHGGDGIRYGRRLYLYDNNEYEKLKSNWEKEFKNSLTSLKVQVTIRRIGEETFHSKK